MPFTRATKSTDPFLTSLALVLSRRFLVTRTGKKIAGIRITTAHNSAQFQLGVCQNHTCCAAASTSRPIFPPALPPSQDREAACSTGLTRRAAHMGSSLALRGDRARRHGGNSKTELLAASLDGELVAHTRGPGNNVHVAGVEATVDFLGRLVAEAGLAAPAAHGVFYLCGVDVPADRSRLTSALARTSWLDRASVDNDVFGLLRAGTDEATRWPSSAAPASTAQAAPPTGGSRATRRSAGSPATGAAA